MQYLESVTISPICWRCKNLLTYKKCKAYPDDYSIPREIWVGKHDHKTPYPRDNGIQFEEREEKSS